ncbi:hypothetical protein CBW65_02195 [Tumebacillus avium]|uniref:Uncharacterized protein n=1 Tax=Tumebacillus avium TaxID=1903704 RepID=A0A1Y0IJK3_9BACL|nr:hypothetical protein [Tumebacillus avium]ARU60006.1 hypothetical protein CBW65_02195 [Tumebacillus avium]
MQDRVGLPESLEKAFEHLKSEPGDFELTKKRAAAWETVRQKGRRGLFLEKWKPFAAGLAGVAVAALAVLIPVQISEWQTAGKPKEVAPPFTYSQNAYEQKADYYRSLGFEVTNLNLETGLDFVYNDNTAYAIQHDKRTKLFDINSDDEVAYLAENGEYTALNVTSNNFAVADDQDDLYIVNNRTLQVQKIDTIGDVMWSLDWNVLPARLLFAQLDLHSRKQQIVSVEWKSGRVDLLLETNERYFNHAMPYYQSVAIDNGYEIKLLVEDGEGRHWREIARSEEGALQTYGIDSDFLHYTDKKALYRYDIRERKATKILATGGEQHIIRPGSSDNGYLISVFKENEPYQPLTSSAMRYGVLELWQVGLDGQAPKKLWEKADVPYTDRRLLELPVTAAKEQPDWIQLKAESSYDWVLMVNRKTDEVKELPVKQEQ